MASAERAPRSAYMRATPRATTHAHRTASSRAESTASSSSAPRAMRSMRRAGEALTRALHRDSNASTARRWASFSTRASALRQPEDARASVSDVARVRLERAAKALKLEREQGWIDVRGQRATFSEFAKRELTRLSDAFESSSAEKAEWERVCADRFGVYASLTAREREAVVRAAEELLAGGKTTTSVTRGVEEEAASEAVQTTTPTSQKKAGKQSIIEGDAWGHALEQGQIRRREVEAVMRNADGASSSGDDVLGTGGGNQEQGSGAWFQLRASRLTASAFSNAIGFWREGRNELWEEKLGLREGFSGNEATEWGSSREDEAVKIYEALTQKKVSHLLFHLLSSDEAELWIGASPDGLIGTNAADTDGGPGGVLEVKCPFNKGQPMSAKPYPTVPWYYIPQVQGLMAVFDRPWVDLFCYTVNGGCAVYRVERNREYWALMYESLSDFWWQHIIPGKHALAAGKDFERYRPKAEHPTCAKLKQWSRDISNSSVTTFISPREVEEIRRKL